MSRKSDALKKPILELKARLEVLMAQPPTTTKEISKIPKRFKRKQPKLFRQVPNRQNGTAVCYSDQASRHDCMDHFEEPRGQGKAIRVELAEKFEYPIACLIDPQDVFPGIGADNQGQAGANAHELKEMAWLKAKMPIVVAGEVHTGRASALYFGGDKCTLKHSIDSSHALKVGASIHWKDATPMEQAAEALHLTAPKLKNLNLVDKVIKEPLGCVYSNMLETYRILHDQLSEWLKSCYDNLFEGCFKPRYQKFRVMGVYDQVG